MTYFNGNRGINGSTRESRTKASGPGPRPSQEEINANKMTHEVRKKIALGERRNKRRVKKCFLNQQVINSSEI